MFMRGIVFLVGILSVLCCVAAAWAVALEPPPDQFITEHPAVTGWMFALLFSVGILGQGFWIGRMIKQNDEGHKSMLSQIDKNRKEANDVNEKQWAAIGCLTKDLGAMISQFNHLKGEHDVIKTYSHHRAGDKSEYTHGRKE